MKKYVTLLVCLFFLVGSIRAQVVEHLDVVYLKAGGFMKGQVVQELDGAILFRMLGNNEVTLPHDLIKRIQKDRGNNVYLQTGQSIKTQGMYTLLSMSSGWGQNQWAEVALRGFYWNLIMGKYVKPSMAIGLGTGIEIQDGPNFNAYTFVPLFVDFRRYPFQKRVSPYYAVGVGYAIGADIFDSWWGEDTYSGGLYLNPSLGLRFARRKKSNLILEMGLKITKANSEFTDWVWNPQTGENFQATIREKRTLQRLEFKFGWLF